MIPKIPKFPSLLLQYYTQKLYTPIRPRCLKTIFQCMKWCFLHLMDFQENKFWRDFWVKNNKMFVCGERKTTKSDSETRFFGQNPPEGSEFFWDPQNLHLRKSKKNTGPDFQMLERWFWQKPLKSRKYIHHGQFADWMFTQSDGPHSQGRRFGNSSRGPGAHVAQSLPTLVPVVRARFQFYFPN